MIKLTHGNKCECGKEFDASGTLIPNVKDREFYGGRIDFFKEVKCECGKEYAICISKKWDNEGGLKLDIIDMVDITKENPIESLRRRPKPIEQRLEEKINTVEHTLTTIVSREAQVETLKLRTMHELQKLCREHKVKFKVTESKLTLINKLLDEVPSLVVANPEG